MLAAGLGDAAWGTQTRLLNRLFAGNEYRIGAADAELPRDRLPIWFASSEFEGAQLDEETGWYYSRVPARGRPIRVAYLALPRWMSVTAFEGR